METGAGGLESLQALPGRLPCLLAPPPRARYLPPPALAHPTPRLRQDKDPGSLPHGQAYQLLWRDVRSAVDLCHRDGTLKREVAANPSKYIHDVRAGGGGGQGVVWGG